MEFSKLANLFTAVESEMKHKASDKNRVVKAMKAVIVEMQENAVLFANAIPMIKEVCLAHETWPVDAKGVKKGENASRGSLAGNVFNTLAVTLRTSYKANEAGEIQELTKEEKAANRDAKKEANKAEAEKTAKEAAEKIKAELLEGYELESVDQIAANLTLAELVAMVILKTGSRENAIKAIQEAK